MPTSILYNKDVMYEGMYLLFHEDVMRKKYLLRRGGPHSRVGMVSQVALSRCQFLLMLGLGAR